MIRGIEERREQATERPSEQERETERETERDRVRADRPRHMETEICRER